MSDKYAFPDPGRAQSEKQCETLTEKGMILRDYFAAKALLASISNADRMSNIEESLKLSDLDWKIHDVVANDAYEFADAMMKARAA